MAKRYLMWVLIAFAAALFCSTFLPIKIILIAAGSFLLASVALLFTKFPLKQTVISCAVSILIAVLFFSGTQIWVKKLQGELIDQERYVAGQVTDLGRNSAGNYTLIEIRLNEIEGRPLKFYEHFKINLYTEAEEVKIGDQISGKVFFFDSPTDYGSGYENRVFVGGYQEAEKILISRPDGFSWVALLAEFQENVRSRLKYGHEKTIGLLESVCLGIKENLDFDLLVSLKRIGLSHVMAVSGLHLSFAVMLLHSFLKLLNVDYRVRYLLNIFVSIFFTAVVGFPPSCVRACVMMVLYSFAMAVGLFSDGLTSLSLAVFILCIYNPLIVRDVGFLLSVAATAGIITMKLPIEHFLFPLRFEVSPKINNLYRNFTGIFSCSLAASIATLPIIIPVFRSVSLIGPLANVILLLPLQWFFEAGILMILLGWIPFIGQMIGLFCDLLYQPIYWVAKILGKYRFASVDHLDLFGIILIIVLLAVLAVSVYHYVKFHRRSFMALFALFLLFSGGSGSLYLAARKNDQVMIHFVDVGQGDCTVISRGNSAVVLDYGGSSDKRYQVVECLNEAGIDQIELLAFTHLHDDHTNGLQTLLKNFYVDRIIYPYEENDNAYLLSLLRREEAQLLLDDHSIKVLGGVEIEPILDSSFISGISDDNERCVCYRVTYGDISVLVTGDLQATAEMQLSKQQVDCTILKVAHHGSDSSSYYPFLKNASPSIAVISVGDNNYGLPDSSVLNRLETICPLIYSTKEHGTITFSTNGEIVERIIS